MISRRNFLKYTGLAIAAAGTGYTTGKISTGPEEEYYVMQGFIPEDEVIIRRTLQSIKKSIKPAGEPVIIDNGFNTAGIKNIIASEVLTGGSGKMIIRINRLDKRIPSDILVSDKSNHIYDPGKDLTVAVSSLREDIKNKPAGLFLSIEYRKTGFFSSLLNEENKAVVFHNDKGIAERLELKKDYSEIVINGMIGKTTAEIKNGIIRVTDSCCKNKICTHTGFISRAGSIIACAPNKVLIRIENV